MAKRLKLDSVVFGGSLPRPAVVEKAYEVQELMTGPEADKIYALDKKMKDVLEDKTTTVDERIRNFERALADFRKVQNDIIENGGVSLVQSSSRMSNEDKDALKEMITNAVYNVLSDSSHMSTEAEGSNPNEEVKVEAKPRKLPIVPTPARSANTSKRPSPAETPDAESIESVNRTPNSKEKSPTARIGEYLEKNGMTVVNNRVYFPAMSNEDGVQVKESSYAIKTYQKAMGVALGPEGVKVPYKAEGAVAAIFNMLRNASGLADLKTRFPNIENNYVASKKSSEKKENKPPWYSID